MSERVIVRANGEGRTLLVGGGDRVTYKARSAETDGSYFCFEVSTTPGFGPPLHQHDYRELFYVLEGEYEFTLQRGDEMETIMGGPGTAVASISTSNSGSARREMPSSVEVWRTPACPSRAPTAGAASR